MAPLYRLVEARHGRFLANPNDLFIGQALIDYGEYSEIETILLLSLIGAGETVVEVGANIGAQTVALARRVGPRGRVYAFEPQPVVFQNLCANLALNDLLNVSALNTACGASEGSVVFPEIDYHTAGNFGAVALDRIGDSGEGPPVEIKPLDSFRLSAVNLLKIDAEGMEGEIIRGAVATIEACRPILYLENNRRDKSEALIAGLLDLGYRLWWHLPPLYNADNWAENQDNAWPAMVSVNMLGIHEDRPADVRHLREISDAADRPF